MSLEAQPAEINHRKIAVDLFNSVWTWMEKPDRTVEEDDKMLNATHASRYHWGEVSTATAVNLARGDWQVSRVYSVLKRPEPCLYHANRCLAICQENGIADFDIAYAYEALARGSMVAGNTEDCQKYLQLAREASENIIEEDDKELLLKDLETIKV